MEVDTLRRRYHDFLTSQNDINWLLFAPIVIQKTLEALQAEEDKVNHLSKVKAKLESSIDEVSLF